MLKDCVNCHHFLSYPCVKFDSLSTLKGIKMPKISPPLAHVVPTHPLPLNSPSNGSKRSSTRPWRPPPGRGGHGRSDHDHERQIGSPHVCS